PTPVRTPKTARTLRGKLIPSGLESCSRMPGDDVQQLMISTSAPMRSSEARVLTHPALQRRSALRERRPHAVRRHTGRVATRFAVLVIGDIVALYVARAVAVWLSIETLNGSLAYGGTPLVQGGSRFVFVGL